MKKILFFIHLFLSVLLSNGQVFQAPNFTLNGELNGTKIYEASEFIDMVPNFNYNSVVGTDEFSASINPNLIFPPTNGEIGGPIGGQGTDGIVGTTPGTFNVGDNGDANYSIPLQFPGDLASMTPELSLIYRSNGPDGILGPNWALGGLSVISCVPATRYHNGNIIAAYANDFFENEDCYTLDGKRLIPLTQGNEREYRTENDVYSKISRLSDDNPDRADPEGFYFRVETKSGLIYNYGEYADSRHTIIKQSSSSKYVISYYVNSVEDVYGNKITFQYDNNGDGEIYISSISYTSNSKIAPERESLYTINFIYIPRNQPIYTYLVNKTTSGIMEVKTKSSKVIQAVECRYLPTTSNILVKKYSLEYINRGPSFPGIEPNLSKTLYLKSIQEYGLYGTSKYNKTLFDWSVEPQYNSFTSGNITLPNRTFTNSQDASNCTIVWENDNVYFTNLDLDIENEILRSYEMGHGVKVPGTEYYSIQNYIVFEYINKNSEGTFLVTNYQLFPIQSPYPGSLDDHPLFSPNDCFISDFNGDGSNDIILYRNLRLRDTEEIKGTEISLHLNLGNTTFSSSSSFIIASEDLILHPKLGDFNGDRITDLVVQNKNGGILHWFLGNSINPLGGNTDSYNGVNIKYDPQDIQEFIWPFSVIDFNGDGISDLCRRGSTSQVFFLEPTPQGNEIQFVQYNINANNYGDLINLNADSKIDYIKGSVHSIIYDNGYDEDVDITLNVKSYYGNGYYINSTNANEQLIDFQFDVPFLGQYTYFNAGVEKISFIPVELDGQRSNDILLKAKLHFISYFDDYQSEPIVLMEVYDTATLFLYNTVNGLKFYPVTSTRLFLKSLNLQIEDFNLNNQSDFLCQTEDKNIFQFLSPPLFNNNLAKITDGIGNSIEIFYGTSADPIIYGPKETFSNTYPIIHYQGIQTLVSSVKRDDGNGLYFLEKYHYKTALFHANGLGYLGFNKIIRQDINRQVEFSTEFGIDPDFNYTYPYIQTKRIINGPLLEQTYNIFKEKWFENVTGKRYYQIQPLNQKTFYYELRPDYSDSYCYKGIEKQYTDYDNFGNPDVITEITTDYTGAKGDQYTKIIDHDYDNYTQIEQVDVWILGRLNKVTSTTFSPGSPPISKEAQFSYYPNGVLQQEISITNDQTLKTTKEYTYDTYGNLLTSSTTGAIDDQVDSQSLPLHIAIRTKTTDYTNDGRFIHQLTDAIGHKTMRVYDPLLALLIEEKDVDNNLSYLYTYDGFGRQNSKTDPNGNKNLTVLRWVTQGDSDAPPNAVYYSWSQSSGCPPIITYFNSLGVEVRKVTQSFEGSKIFVDSYYNNKGQIDHKTLPYQSGSPLFNYFEYDPIGRIKKFKSPTYNGFAETIYSYQDLTTSVTNPKGQISRKRINVLGWLMESTDANNGSVKYEYYSDGLIKKSWVNNFDNSYREYRYDELGNTIYYFDNSQGLLTYAYNSFRELIWKENSNRQRTNFLEFDNLGRYHKIVTPENEEFIYTYDTQKAGLLDNISGPNDKIQYVYDDYLRIKTEIREISEESFLTQYDYDEFSRLRKYTYPTSYAIKYQYKNGHQYKITEALSNKKIWEARSINVRDQYEIINLGENIIQNNTYQIETGRLMGQVVNHLQNNTYNYDILGNLIYRSTLNGKIESFNYDNLNRLKEVYYNNSLETNYNYDALGNLIYKSDVGNYSYGNSNNPYDLTAIDNQPPTINSLFQTITYTSFNKVSQITEKDPITGEIKKQLDLVYGINQARIEQILTEKDKPTIFKKYVSKDFEKITIEDQVTYVHYINSPQGPIAILSQTDQEQKLEFFIKDHLGSIQVLAEQNGNLIEEYSYDPWGLRRDPVTFEVYPMVRISNTDQGFTGHEHLDLFALINMDGRIYDPVIGRFISPDPYLQFPDFTQGLNPYSYVLNNPLSLTDPTGYSLIGQFVGLTLTTILSLTPGVNFIVIPLAYSVVMTIDYALEQGRSVKMEDIGSYFIQTLAISTINMGGTKVIGGIFDAMAEAGKSMVELKRALAHGLFNGGIRMIQGGKFEHGFLSGFVSSLAGSQLTSANGLNLGQRVILSAAIGGTVEKLGGGKFANGAVTGAYVMVLNHLAMLPQTREVSSDINDYREMRKFESQEGMIRFLVAASRATGVEMHGTEVQNGTNTEYYVMPAIDTDPSVGQTDYTNDNENSTFDPSRFPQNYKIVRVYHTHLTCNGPSPGDSRSAALLSSNSFVISLGNETVWRTDPKLIPPILPYYGKPVGTINQLLNGVKF